jgi:hypothetical protein
MPLGCEKSVCAQDSCSLLPDIISHRHTQSVYGCFRFIYHGTKSVICFSDNMIFLCKYYIGPSANILYRYNCNRYDEEEAKAARDAQERSRAALQRYLFYCNRYMNHMQSLKFEHKLYASVKEKMEEMQQHNMSWIEVITCFAVTMGILVCLCSTFFLMPSTWS